MHPRELVQIALLATMIVSFVHLPRPAYAASANTVARVEQLHVEAVAMFRAGKYGWARKKFSEAYAIYPDPKLLYNIGRCYEAMGDIPQAIKYFDRCAKDPKVEQRVRIKANKKIRLLQGAEDQSKAVAPIVRRPIATPPQRTGAANPQAMALPMRRGPGWIGITKWITGVAGLALLGGGATAIAMGMSDQSDVDDAIDNAQDGIVSAVTRADALEQQDRANDKKILGYVLGGLGLATLAASATLFVLDTQSGSREEASTTRDVQLSLMPSRDGGAVALQGTF